MHRPVPLAALLTAMLMLWGCPDGRQPAAVPQPRAHVDLSPAQCRDLAAGMLAFHRQAAAVTAEILVRIKPAHRDALIFSLAVASPASGAIRVRASKLGVDFCDVLIQPDGTFTASLVRSREVVRGRLEDLLDPPDRVPGAEPARIIDELKVGPLPFSPSYHGNGRDLTLVTRDPATGLDAVVCRSADSQQAVKKRLVGTDGRTLLVLAYGGYRNFGGLERPSRMIVSTGDGVYVCSIRLRELDPVAGISAGRMDLAVPAGTREISASDFLRELSR